jgi:type IV fimbrial biogenesis protein FimT
LNLIWNRLSGIRNPSSIRDTLLQTVSAIEKAMKKEHTGFTLVELMITLAVGITILGIGIPAFTGMMASNRTTGYANEMIGALRLARSEAVKRGEGVTICASNTANTACDGANWQNGWLLFTDPDNDRTYTAASDTLVRVWQAPEGGVVFDSAPNNIRFRASGELSGSVADFAFQSGDCSGDQARTVSISRMGRPNITRSTCF